MRRNRTNPDSGSEPLSEAQSTGIELLLAGRNLTRVAEALGVARQTVSTWYNRDAAFQAALNFRRQELHAELHDRLRAALPTAVDVLEQELTGPLRLQAAVHLMKITGIYGAPPKTGPTDADEIRSNDAQNQLFRSLGSFL